MRYTKKPESSWVTERDLKSKILIAASCGLLTACAATSLYQGDSKTNKRIDAWGLDSNAERTSAFVQNDSDSFFSVTCYYDSGCIAILSNGEFCESDARIPLLMNTKSGAASSAYATCLNESKDPKESGILSFDINELPDGFTKGQELSFLTPMSNNQFKVSRFTLEGSGEALQKTLDKLNSYDSAKKNKFSDKVF